MVWGIRLLTVLLKGLLAVPFVLLSQPTAAWEEDVVPSTAVANMARTSHQRYVQIMRDVEDLINDHSKPTFLPCSPSIQSEPAGLSFSLMDCSFSFVRAAPITDGTISSQSPTNGAAQLRAPSSSSLSPQSVPSSRPFSSPKPSPIKTNGDASAPAALSLRHSMTSASR